MSITFDVVSDLDMFDEYLENMNVVLKKSNIKALFICISIYFYKFIAEYSAACAFVVTVVNSVNSTIP